MGEGKKVWFCGKVKSYPEYDFLGVYDTEQKAIDECKTDKHFIGPLFLNDTFSDTDDMIIWLGAYYPLLSENISEDTKNNGNSMVDKDIIETVGH